MKSSRVMKIFEQYVRKYDMNNVNIKAKYFHSLKVMEIAKELANGLGIFDEEEISKFGSDTPMGRAGQPNEVAPCFLFFASDDSSYLTGQTLHPNGGFILNG